MVRIVADDAIGWLQVAFGNLGDLVAMPGHAIDRVAVANADVLLTRSVTRVDDTLVAGSRLRFIGSCTAGVDHVDLDALSRRGVTFRSAPGCNARAVAEYVVTGLYALWAQEAVTTDLEPIAVVGFGHVGRRVTALLRALGHEVRVCDPPLQARAEAGSVLGDDPLLQMARDEPYLPLEVALAGARVATLHVPLTRGGRHSTRHLLGPRGLARLARDAIVVNTSRGSVVDEAALESWIRGSDGGAILDVWEGEPRLRWSLLRGSPSPARLATPHIAGYTLEAKLKATTMIHEALANWLGVDPTFGARDVLADSEPLPLVPDLGSAATGRDVLARCLLAAHPLDRDDARLRALLGEPMQARAAGFEALRRGYTFRRELTHHRIDPRALADLPVDGLHEAPVAALAALGVQMHPDA